MSTDEYDHHCLASKSQPSQHTMHYQPIHLMLHQLDHDQRRDRCRIRYEEEEEKVAAEERRRSEAYRTKPYHYNHQTRVSSFQFSGNSNRYRYRDTGIFWNPSNQCLPKLQRNTNIAKSSKVPVCWKTNDSDFSSARARRHRTRF